MVDFTDLAAVNSLLQNASDHVNSFIILFVPYPFLTLSTLIKTLSSFCLSTQLDITHDVSAVHQQYGCAETEFRFGFG